jgi:hypothetical protein
MSKAKCATILQAKKVRKGAQGKGSQGKVYKDASAQMLP